MPCSLPELLTNTVMAFQELPYTVPQTDRCSCRISGQPASAFMLRHHGLETSDHALLAHTSLLDASDIPPQLICIQ